MSYIQIAKRHPKYLTYGGLHYFFSSVGQTFLISVCVPFILKDLELSSQAFSNSYAVATIASAFTLPLVGGFVDRARLTTLSALCGIGIIFAAVVMFSSHSLYVLIPGLFLIRFFGQGGMVLIGSTAVAKFFTLNRGKALSLASMGLAAAETFMPLVFISVIAWLGWNNAWLFLATLVLLIFIPSTYFLVRNQTVTSEEPVTAEKITYPANAASRRTVLRDPNFYLIVPAYVFLPFFITGIFIHQNLVAAAKGWTMEWMALTFIGYGIAKVLTSFLGGALIDKFSGKKVFLFYLAPLAVGLLLLVAGEHRIFAMAYMILLGMTASLGSLTGVAIWAELYGTKNLAAIKSMITTIMVIASALGPIVIGWGLERSLQITLYTSLAAIICLSILSVFGMRRK